MITHYADLVKYVCKTFFDWDGNKDEYGRQMLQYVGTDVVRKANPNYWVNFIIDMLKFFGDNWDFAIIPDARFPNEIERFKAENYDVTHLRVERHGFDNHLTPDQQKHASETSLDDSKPDYVIHNDGSLADLDRNVREYIREAIYGE